MKFTLSWLKDHLETDASLDALEKTLSSIGLEVESIENPAEALDAFVVARITDAKPHPDADRLQVVQVEVAPGQPTLEVVCGAPNARKGLVGVFAPIGTYVPGLDVTLSKRPVRGVVSNGMMCSAAELQLSDEADGIIDLENDMAKHIGTPYVAAAGLDDPVIDVAITPNRPDCTGVRGIARDLAAAGLGTLKPEPEIGNVDGKQAPNIKVALKFASETADACPVFAARMVMGVQNTSSPDWMQRRLHAVGLRPINALVDVTNYVAHDRGRPLHVYDADKVKGTIHARLGKQGESFKALDGNAYQVNEDMCVIADDSGPLGLGGVIGGESTGATEKTTNVLIESAWFDPVRTAATGRTTGLITDARYRFERGVDPGSVLPGLDIATDWILKLTGGTPSKATVAGNVPKPDHTISFDPARVTELTGLEIDTKSIKQILQDLGFVVTGRGKTLNVSVPSWRPDVHGAADLVEEVVRIAGLDKVPSTPLPRARGVAAAVLTPTQRRTRTARRALAARGMVEAVTWSFIPQAEAEHFDGGAPDLQLDNPISVEMSTMRPSLLPGLLAALHRNHNRGFHDAALFEIGQTYAGLDDAQQHLVAAGVRSGTETLFGSGRHWQQPAQNVDVFDAKADLAAILTALGLDVSNAQITRDAPEWYHPGRSGVVRLGPKRILGQFGEIHPRTRATFNIDGPVVGFELFVDALPPEKSKSSRAKPVLPASDLLPVRRDFAFIVDENIEAAAILNAARKANKSLISDVTVFDVFEGDALAKDNKKSVGIEVTLQPDKDTLTDADIDSVGDAIVASVKKATGGVLRS